MWPDSTSGIVRAAASVSRRGSCASRTMVVALAPRDRRAMSAVRLVQKRMPTRSSASPLIVRSRPRVLQHLDAVLRQRRRHVVIVVVIAENGEDAVRRGERRERFGATARRSRRSPQVT